MTRHVSYECRCQCGHTTHACLPEGVRYGVNYGPNTEALAAYLLHGQCVPMARVRHFATPLISSSQFPPVNQRKAGPE